VLSKILCNVVSGFVFLILIVCPAQAGAICPCYIERELKYTNPPMCGIDVSDLQLRLAQLGYYIGPLNGIYDKQTLRAVINFQQAHNINPSGHVNSDTWSALGQGIKTSSYRSVQQKIDGDNIIIVIDTERLLLSVFVDNKLYRQYPVAIGKYSSPSPVGEWKIINKGYELGGSFGTRWMGLNVPWGNYGIHGTNRPWSIGWAASAGCFRMYNKDIEEIYPLLPVGTPVIVKGNYVTPTGILKPGHSSPEVVTVQSQLREKGFYLFGPTDGDYGIMTELAIKMFQILNGLKSTGIADVSTLKTLDFEIPDG